MSKDDIDKAVKEAEQYAAEDKKRREETDLRNEADQMIYQSEKTVTDMGDKLTEEDKSSVSSACETLKEALKGTDLEDIKAKKEELQKAIYAISEKVYKAAAEEAQANGENNGAPEGNADGEPVEGDVYEADFKDADENN